MKHNPREIRNALFSLIQEVGKNTSCFVRNPERDFTRKRKLDMERKKVGHIMGTVCFAKGPTPQFVPFFFFVGWRVLVCWGVGGILHFLILFVLFWI